MKRTWIVIVLALLLGLPSVARAAEGGGAGPLWHKTCGTDRSGKSVCIIEQFAIAMPQNVVAAHIRLTRDGAPEGQARMILTVPLGVLLNRGITLSVDGSKPIELPFERCTREGCEASAMLDRKALALFMRGRTLMVRYAVSDRREPLDIPIRLQGLTDALKSLSK